MIEVSSVLFFILAAWGLGCACLIGLNLEKFKWLSIVTGYCIMLIIHTWGYYFLNLTVQILQPTIYILAVFALLVLWKKGKLADGFHVLFAMLCVFCFISIPILIGGEQFYVFRGNHWDTFNIWTQVLTFWAAPASTYATNMPPMEYGLQLVSPGFLFVQQGMGQTAAGVMFHGFGNPHLIMAFYSIAICAISYTVYKFAWNMILQKFSVDGESSPNFIMRELPPIAVTVGFWAQWTYDIGSWPQLMCYSPMVALFFTTYQYLASKADWKSRERFSLITLISILIAVGLVTYPATAMYICILCLASFLWLLLTRQWRSSIKPLLLLLSVPVIVCIILFPVIHQTYEFVLRQLHEADNAFGWWTYFDRYWLGMERAPRKILIFFNLIPSVLGLYFITPVLSVGKPIAMLWYAAIVLFGFLAIYCILLATLQNIFKDKGVLFFLQLVCISACVPLIFYLTRDLLWTLGKALGYVSPFFLLFVLSPLGKRDAWRTSPLMFRPFIIIAFIVFAGHLVFGLARPISAFDKDGIGYDNNIYPSLQWRGIKTDYEWALDLSAVPKKSNVLIYTGNLDFYLHYIKQKLTYNKCQYWHLETRKSYYGEGGELPLLSVPEKTDFIIKQDVSSGKNRLRVVPVIDGHDIYDLLWQEVVDVRYDNGREQIQIEGVRRDGWTSGPHVSLRMTIPPKIVTSQGLQITIPILSTFGEQELIVRLNEEEFGAFIAEEGKSLVLFIAGDQFDSHGKVAIELSLPRVLQQEAAQKIANSEAIGIYLNKILFSPIIDENENPVKTRTYMD